MIFEVEINEHGIYIKGIVRAYYFSRNSPTYEWFRRYLSKFAKLDGTVITQLDAADSVIRFASILDKACKRLLARGHYTLNALLKELEKVAIEEL